MPVRSPLVLAAVAVSLLACAGSRQQARLREQLDAYSIPKPLGEVWPDALRYVSKRGYGLVGKDRRFLGEEDPGGLATFFAKGHATQAESERRWVAETLANDQQQRYRVVGIGTGPSSCQIQYYSLTAEDPLKGGNFGAPDKEYRDVQLELDFVEEHDAARAEKMIEAARAK